MRHKHADLIYAWAEDDSMRIQIKIFGEWRKIDYPRWDEKDEYRIKPNPKRDVFYYEYFHIAEDGLPRRISFGYSGIKPLESESGLKLTFDGETGKLKKTEVI